jgi:hypothetical protein
LAQTARAFDHAKRARARARARATNLSQTKVGLALHLDRFVYRLFERDFAAQLRIQKEFAQTEMIILIVAATPAPAAAHGSGSSMPASRD